MTIEKNSFKMSKFYPEYQSQQGRDTVMASDDEDLQRRNSISAVESDDEEDDQFDECDSGAGSDDFDLLELGGTGEEFCQVGGQTCSLPYELYDLPGLKDVLSMEVWNEVLTEEEIFDLAKYLPDMDQENFVRTMKELFAGDNLHFGSPIDKLFEMLKGGLCEPRVALYRQGLKFFQRKQHYHNIRQYQNTMVNSICQIRDAWMNCKGYSIEEKLRVLNIKKCQKSLMNENMEEFGSESSEREETGKKAKDRKLGQKTGWYSGYGRTMAPDISYPTLKNQYPKGTMKLAGSKATSRKGEEETTYEVAVHGDHNFSRIGTNGKSRASKSGKKHEGPRAGNDLDSYMGLPLHALGRNKAINQLSDIQVLTTKPSNGRIIYDGGRKGKFPENLQPFSTEISKNRNSNLSLKGSQIELLDGSDPSWPNSGIFPADLSYIHTDLNAKNKKLKKGRVVVDLKSNNKLLHSSYRANKFQANYVPNGGIRTFARSDETESDSSDQIDEDEDEDENPLMRSKWAYPVGVPDLKPIPGTKRAEFSEKDSKDHYFSLNGSPHGEDLEIMRAEQKGKMHDVGYFNVSSNKYFTGPGNVIGGDNIQQFYPLGTNGRIEQNHGYTHRYNLEDDLFWNGVSQKKRKIKDDSVVYMDMLQHNNDASPQLVDASSSRKRGKNKLEDANNVPEIGIPEPPTMEIEAENFEAEIKPQRKSFPLITPTVHTGFSFSIIHLLSAVRTAMITLLPEDSKDDPNKKKDDSNPLPVQEIMNRVRSNPGDPCILETQEPLQDLIRGVLKIFSTRTAPLGAKGWKPLVVYEKSTKSWSWVGPASQSISETEVLEEVTSPDAWGLPHKILVKLVDAFANWLKNSQETLQQIGTLPDPPLTLTENVLDEKERFKDLKAQKSLSTINPSSEEVRAYFRKEELLRYLIPDRAFSYTALDGKKSIVAPLRRCGGKPTSKARDHFMLKRDRPPHVTILCLVRDAAARLPGKIGTRSDVCTLIRDSQYVVEDVSDVQVNQVVSGALDRLHYEIDPCVKFEGERKLWVYLHRDREEEDFEDDGTSSTKKWRRGKKEATADLVSDVNVEAGDINQVEEGAGNSHGVHLDLTPVIMNEFESERELVCREDSNKEDFDEDVFGGA